MALPKAIKERTDKPLADRYVSMSNALARSAHSLTLAEKRVVAIGLAKTDSVPGSDLIKAQHNGWAVRVSATEYAETFDVDANTAYEALQDAAIHLVNRKVRTFRETRTGIKEDIINWCAKSSYHHGEGWLEIHFTQFVAPHLLALRGQFISYRLRQAEALRSIYSWRLMEFLETWSKTGFVTTGIDDFLLAMDAPDSCRKDFKALRTRVIEPAIKELLAKNGLLISYATQRQGRKVIGLEFRFEQGPQSILDLE